MPAPLPIRRDRSPAELRRLARHERHGRVSARLLALANALEGLLREEAARLAGMTGQMLGVGSIATMKRASRVCATGRGRAAPAPWTKASRRHSRRWSSAAPSLPTTPLHEASITRCGAGGARWPTLSL